MEDHDDKTEVNMMPSQNGENSLERKPPPTKDMKGKHKAEIASMIPIQDPTKYLYILHSNRNPAF